MVLTYRIDAGDRLVEVNDDWKRFAIANDAPELVDGALNRPLWAFIVDPTTTNVYRQLVSRVRGGRAVTFPFRCDAPSVRRWMEMRMSALPNDGILFESAVIDTLPSPAGSLWDRRAARSADLVLTCSWCKRVRVEERWEEIEQAVGSLLIFMHNPVPMMTHGMCPQCYASIMESLDAVDPPRG